MKSVMKHSFSQNPTIDCPRSKFDRSHGYKTTFDANWLIPFYWDAVLPGDTFNMRTQIFARMSTPLYPLLDNMSIDTHYFFVPNRIIWDNWRKFCGEQVDPGDSIDYVIPVIEGTLASDADSVLTTNAGRKQALMNYLGVPDGLVPDNEIANADGISALPFRAYMRIYSEWFRDQNLIDTPDPSMITNDGPDDMDTNGEGHILMRRGKRYDYFTSCLPWPQKGDAVTLPLGTSAPVKGIGAGAQNYVASPTVYESGETASTSFTTASDINTTTWHIDGTAATGGFPNIYADLTNATAATINDLREAFQVQKLLERDARAGTRYPEIIKNHFQVDFYDASYRPEYLGGGSQPITITPVAATTDTTVGSNTEVGDLGAMGFSSGTHGFSKSFVEHGIVMGIMSVRADLTYQQGLDRHFSHSTRYDIYWPSLAHLGEQAVLRKELYADGTIVDQDVFGYQERYAEYRYKPSKVTRLFQSAATSSLDAWHLSQELSSPVLNQTFIEEDTPIDRVVATPGEPHFIADIYNNLICARPLPVFGVPGMIDHF
jgi:hypothetical protein